MLQASEFVQIQNITKTQAKVVEKIQGWRMFQRHLENTLFIFVCFGSPSKDSIS